MGRRISRWEDMTPAEMAHAANGGRWNFRHCNGRFCSADSVVDGSCGGQCRTGQTLSRPGSSTGTGSKSKAAKKATAKKGAAKKATAAKPAPKATPRAAAAARGATDTERAGRKKEAAKAKRARTRTEWDGYEESAYQSAESATRGHMERKGSSSSILGVYWPRGRRPWGAASKDLVQYWDGGGMVPVTLTEYQAGRRSPQGRPWTDPDDRPKRKRGRRRG